jgi:hypothetical protein
MHAKASCTLGPDDLRSLDLVIGKPERVLICTRVDCGYALQVSDKRVSRHLWEKHQVPKESRRGLDKYVQSLNLLDPRQVPPRRDGTGVHQQLQKLRGFACRMC